MVNEIYKQLLNGQGRISGPVSYIRRYDLIIAMYDNKVECDVSHYQVAHILINNKTTGRILWYDNQNIYSGTREEFWKWVNK